MAAVRRLVVVGASLAGLRAAQAARSAGFEGELIVLGKETHRPYNRPPLSKEVLHGGASVEACALPSDDLDITWRLGEGATDLDLAARTVGIAGGEDLAYDRLVVATGCRPREWAGPGAGLAGVHTLRHLEDAVDLAAALDARPARLAIVGAGFLGCEVASAARAKGVEVTLIEAAPLPMMGLGEEVARRCAEIHRDHGVELRLGVGVERLVGDRDGRVAMVETKAGADVEADLVLVAMGAVPNVGWLARSGLSVDRGVRCDRHLAAHGADDVYCAGDLVSWPHPLAGGEEIRIEHWTNAAEQGAVAGRNAVVPAAERRSYQAVPSFWSDQYDAKIQAVGLPSVAARLEVVEESPDRRRLVAAGMREGRVVAAVAINAARRLPWYRRTIGDGATFDEVRAMAAEDSKSLGSPGIYA